MSSCYPSPTCMPHAQGTLSVGFCLIHRYAQIGYGLVMTQVITTSPRDHLFALHVACQRSVSFLTGTGVRWAKSESMRALAFRAAFTSL
jgi:hypothetical protein